LEGAVAGSGEEKKAAGSGEEKKAQTLTFRQAHTHACVYTRTHLHTQIHKRTRAHAHAHTHTHTHTCTHMLEVERPPLCQHNVKKPKTFKALETTAPLQT